MDFEIKDSEKPQGVAAIAPASIVSDSVKDYNLSNSLKNELPRGDPNQNNYIVDDSSNVNSVKHHCAPQRDPESNNITATSKEQHGRNGQQSIPHSVFPKRTRTFIIVIAAVCAFVSPVSGNIYFPALNGLSAEPHGLTPTFIVDLAETTSRRPAYIIGFTIYIGACVGLALQTSYPALLILRSLQATGSSSSIALAAAVAADVSTAQDRGTYMGWVNGGALVGPAIGPVLGGILAQFLGWRAIFWFLVIFTGVLVVPLILAFPETCRNVVGNGSIPPQRWNRDLLSVIRQRRARAKSKTSELQLEHMQTQDSMRSARETQTKIRKTNHIRFPNPLSTLKILKEKDVALLLLYNCLVYSSYYSVTSSLPYLFARTYHFNALQIGLSFIPYGVGALFASLFNGRILDWRFRQVENSLGIVIKKGETTDTRHFPLEKVRLSVALVPILIGNSALLCYGWVLQVHAPLAAPLVLLFFIGYCISGSFNICSVAIVDYYPTSPAVATAGNNLCRCLLGAGEAAVIIQMIEAMGRGWCFTLIALIIYMTVPILWVIMHYGPAWREERAQKIDAEKMVNAAREGSG